MTHNQARLKQEVAPQGTVTCCDLCVKLGRLVLFHFLTGVLLLFQVYTYKQNALTRQKVQPMHHSSIAGVEDMATLEDLHEGAIMHNLFLRYQQRRIYVSFPAAAPHRATEADAKRPC